MNGTMSIGHGMNRNGILSGLVLLTIGPVTGHDSMTNWSYWPEDWSWNTQEWWTIGPGELECAASSGANVPQDTAKNEPPPNASAVTVEPSDQTVPRVRKLSGE